MRPNLVPVITADKSFQYVVDIGIGAHDINDLLEKLPAVFTCIRETGMELTSNKCAFGLTEIHLLGNTLISEDLTPIKQQTKTSSKHSECHETQNQ